MYIELRIEGLVIGRTGTTNIFRYTLEVSVIVWCCDNFKIPQAHSTVRTGSLNIQFVHGQDHKRYNGVDLSEYIILVTGKL